VRDEIERLEREAAERQRAAELARQRAVEYRRSKEERRSLRESNISPKRPGTCLHR